MGGKHTDCVAALQRHRALAGLDPLAALLLLAVADITHDQDETPCCWPGYEELGARLWGEYRSWQDSKIRALFRQLADAGHVERARSRHPKPKHRRQCPRDARVLHYEVYLIKEKPVQSGPESEGAAQGETGPDQTGSARRNRSKSDQETGPNKTAPIRNTPRNATRQENATTTELRFSDGDSYGDSEQPTAVDLLVTSANSVISETAVGARGELNENLEIEDQKAAVDTSSVKRRGSNAGEPATLDASKNHDQKADRQARRLAALGPRCSICDAYEYQCRPRTASGKQDHSFTVDAVAAGTPGQGSAQGRSGSAYAKAA